MVNPPVHFLNVSVLHRAACRCLIVVAMMMFATRTSRGQSISPHLIGNNLWLANRGNPTTTPSTAVMNLAGEAGIRLIRIGGNEFDKNMPSDQALLIWVNRIRAIGAEPLIQVSQFRSAAQAAATVEFINVTSKAKVVYWSIGNEPWLQAKHSQDPDPSEAQIAATIESYFKPISAAMKAVDSSIRIFGVDSEDFQSGLHSRLFGGMNNIAGKVPGQSYYYCDGLSWHRYPQADGIDPAYQGLADIRGRIEDCRDLIDAVNTSQDRAGPDALQWGIGEFNSKNGGDVHTWGNGQMFAGVYGLCMKHGADFSAAWSLYESDGKRTSTDFGLLDGGGLVPRPSYWHTQFVSRHFSGRYLEGNPSISSNSSGVLVYGAEDESKEQVSVMILNRGTAGARPYTLHLNRDGTYAPAGATALNIDASRSEVYEDIIPPRSTHVLVFRRESFTRIVYSNDDFIAGIPPQTTVTARSPLRGVLDSFDGYLDFAGQGYWKGIHSGEGQASTLNGNLVLRASDTAHASATIGSSVSPSFNFFNRGYAITLDGFEQSAADLQPDDTQFRICLNSTSSRSYGADDSFVLRVNPHNIRLGCKINQPGVQGELRTGTDIVEGALLDMEYIGALRIIRLALEPAATIAGQTTVLYRIQLDGSFGRIVRAGSFTASATDWGNGGESALVLESRRNSAVAGGPGSYAEARVETISHQPLLLDEFDAYTAFPVQDYWQPLLVGSSSSAGIAGGSAMLSAQSLAFASAAIAGSPIPELNFFRHGFTLDLKDITLMPNNLQTSEAYFRISLCSTAQRSFTTPDALTLRLTPDSLRFGYKLDLPSVDAELRTGPLNSSLIDEPSPGLVTGVRLTLIPMGPPSAATPILFAMRLTSPLGDTIRTGTFTADYSLWGAGGDSSLVIEARRASPSTGDASSYMQVTIGSVHFSPLPDDFSSEAPTFNAWRLSQFTLEELVSESVSGPNGNPAGDGMGNLLKYALGHDARIPVPTGSLPGLLVAEGSPIRFVHEERSGASDLSYRVEVSTNMGTWELPVVEESRVIVREGWISVTSRVEIPDGAPAIFCRLRVNSPPAP
jgi:hypothetical protein